MGGIWVLAIVLNIGHNSVITQPWIVYPNAQFGYYECLQDKKNYTKTLVYKFTLTCERFGET